MSTPFEPQQFGRFYLIDKIAAGGMAEVFKAKTYSDGGFEKLQVIKRILSHLSDNEEFIDMFIDEAKISVELQHPNIVQIYDFGKINNDYFISMECVEGKDIKCILRKLARRRKLLPPEYAVLIAHEMCKGLDYAHKKDNLHGDHLGIVHRDISPSNIIVGYSGQVKVADFGIAKAGISLYSTKDGVLKGKFEYMSPEQASGKPIDFRSDIFAAGIILHEMLTGRRLFKTDSEIRTLEKIKAVDVRRPAEVNPGVPARLDEIVMRALQLDPADRFMDAKAFQTALLEYMYPSTPDVIRESMHLFMVELFAEEVAAERDRLRSGSVTATALYEAAPELSLDDDWRGGTGSTSAQTLQTTQSRVPLMLAGVAVVLLAAIAIFFAIREPETRVVERMVEAPKATHAAMQLRIQPEVPAQVFIDDVLVAEGTGRVSYEEVLPGLERKLRVVAEGYEPFEDTLSITAGDRLRLPIQLQAIRTGGGETTQQAPPPDQTTDAPPDAIVTRARFKSSPRGAEIFVDGRSVGYTPAYWSDGESGKAYAVEYKKSGYQSTSFTLVFPPEGETKTTSKSLQQVAAEPGKVSVNVRGGWAWVYIDGNKVDTTPLSNHVLSPGAHTIRVANEETGVDSSQQITVTSGKLSRVNF